MLTPSKDPTEADFAGKLRLVYGISRLLSAALEEQGLLQRACRLLANDWPSPHVTFVEGVADGSVKLRAFAGELSEEAAAAVTMQSRWDASARAQNTIGEAFRSGTPIMMRAADIPYEPYRAYALRSGIAAAASFPIWIEDQRGALTIATYNPAAFSDLELELLQGLTEDIARTVEQVRTRYELFEERRRAQARLERLEALWEFASGNLDVDALARAIVAEGTARLHLDWGGIARIAGERVCFDVVPEDDPLDMARVSAPLQQSVTGHAHLVGRTVHCADITADPEYSRLKRDGTRGLRAIIAAPFSAGTDGHVLIFGSPAPREQPFPAEDIEYVELLAAFFARNLQRREDLQQIAFLQNHDPLSGLPNRFNFLQQLRQAFARAERGGEPLAVLLIDIERFKAIADEHGTEMAEQALLELRNRLQRTLGPDDTLFRHARDGFAVIKTRWPAIGDVDAFAHRTIAALEEPIALGEASLRVAIYAGLAISPDDGRNAEDLEIAAEAALRRAKREAVSGHRFYSSELDAQLAHRRMISLELRRAIENERLVLHFQPIVNVATSATISYEALVRWPHPERGIIMPGHFIPLAEESDLILLLGDFVLRRAARAARTFVERGLMLPIAVNISAAQFADPQFLERLRATLAQAGVSPAMIELELTESVAMRDPHLTRALMQECRALGVRIALDDFGTGHSSLAVLRRLPIEILKLDKTFVAGLPDDAEDAAIARAVLALGKSLRCEVRAEGVESEDQAAWLRGEGCDSAQGYFFSRPQPPESFGLA